VLLGLAVIYGQTEKANYESKKVARASDNAAADQAALQQAARDREWRAQIDAQHQADMADLQQKATTRETAIRNAPASAGPHLLPIALTTTACGESSKPVRPVVVRTDAGELNDQQRCPDEPPMPDAVYTDDHAGAL
jgi:hypothetical protein